LSQNIRIIPTLEILASWRQNFWWNSGCALRAFDVQGKGRFVDMAHGRPAKRRRITPPIGSNAVSETIQSTDLFDRAADWDLEQIYEQRSRSRKQESTRLPIKTVEGRIQHVEETVVSEDEESFLGSGSATSDGIETPPTDGVDETPAIPLREQIVAAKEELARIAVLLNEDPEEHAGSFKKLANIAAPTSNPTIRKLALATQAAVYKDVIPGYRIRAYTDEDVGAKVSKEVRRTRQYEQALVSSYQGYVKQLGSLAKLKGSGGDGAGLKSVAINCACTLLTSVPHFNFRTELLNILILQLSSREVSPDFIKCVDTMEAFFAADEDGAPSLEAVTLLAKMMKAKDYKVEESVLNTFLHLRLLTELSVKGSTSKTDKPDERLGYLGKKAKRKWEHRSKKEKKAARERKVVEKDFKEAEAIVNYEDREKLQSETLKMVFVTYFRILKIRSPHLTGAVLEGLARYAHLINQDFFGDLLEALKDIINQADFTNGPDRDESAVEVDENAVRNMTRETLLSTQTAFTLLSGQDVSKYASGLHLDLSFFTSYIYRALYPLSLDSGIELGPKSVHLPDPHSSSSTTTSAPNKINIATPTLVLIRVLTSILLGASSPPPTLTAASFFKRLLTASLQLPEKSTYAILSLMTKVADKHSRKIESLWYSDERKGDGIFHGESESIEGTNVFAVGSGVWECELLRHHYCPQVREDVKALDKIIANFKR
jgi:nucleolar complex protein 3